MTEEQIKSIEYLKEYIEIDKENIEICEENDFYEEAKHINERVKHFETILNLIEKQQNKIKLNISRKYTVNSLDKIPIRMYNFHI